MSKTIINSLDQQQLDLYDRYIKYLPFSDCVNSTADLREHNREHHTCVIVPFGDIQIVVKNDPNAFNEEKVWHLATFLESNLFSPNSITLVDAMLEENKFLCIRIVMEMPDVYLNVLNSDNYVLTPENIKEISRTVYCEHIVSPFMTPSNNELLNPTVKKAGVTYFNIDKKLIH